MSSTPPAHPLRPTYASWHLRPWGLVSSPLHGSDGREGRPRDADTEVQTDVLRPEEKYEITDSIDPPNVPRKIRIRLPSTSTTHHPSTPGSRGRHSPLSPGPSRVPHERSFVGGIVLRSHVPRPARGEGRGALVDPMDPVTPCPDTSLPSFVSQGMDHGGK